MNGGTLRTTFYPVWLVIVLGLGSITGYLFPHLVKCGTVTHRAGLTLQQKAMVTTSIHFRRLTYSVDHVLDTVRLSKSTCDK